MGCSKGNVKTWEEQTAEAWVPGTETLKKNVEAEEGPKKTKEEQLER